MSDNIVLQMMTSPAPKSETMTQIIERVSTTYQVEIKRPRKGVPFCLLQLENESLSFGIGRCGVGPYGDGT